MLRMGIKAATIIRSVTEEDKSCKESISLL